MGVIRITSTPPGLDGNWEDLRFPFKQILEPGVFKHLPTGGWVLESLAVGAVLAVEAPALFATWNKLDKKQFLLIPCEFAEEIAGNS